MTMADCALLLQGATSLTLLLAMTTNAASELAHRETCTGAVRYAPGDEVSEEQGMPHSTQIRGYPLPSSS
jgi:hypothetical protein